jgi:ATP-dependent DNA helicase PIF1
MVTSAKLRDKRIAITALTGCAATLLQCGASTLHSWAGIGLANASAEDLARQIMEKPAKKSNWLRTQILIIDEISMLSPQLFDKIETIARIVRRNQRPFGGIQLICVGDFFQLPPVQKTATHNIYCFQSPQWQKCMRNTYFLTKIYRQDGDSIFQRILNDIRIGKISDEDIAILREHQISDDIELNDIRDTNGIRPTQILPHNIDVEYINNTEFEKLASNDIRTFIADVKITKREMVNIFRTNPTQIQNYIEIIDKNNSYVTELKLCIGAQVMLITNLDVKAGLANGSRGVISGFSELTGNPQVTFRNGITITIDRHYWETEDFPGLKRGQIPLVIAYAITIHKSQGMSVDSAIINVGSSVFDFAQTYVALSRVKSLDGLYLIHFDPSRIRADPIVIDYYNSFLTSPII